MRNVVDDDVIYHHRKYFDNDFPSNITGTADEISEKFARRRLAAKLRMRETKKKRRLSVTDWNSQGYNAII